MKAVVQDKYGSPDDLELRDVAMPTIGDDEVLVRVRAASVHTDVWHVVTGRPHVLRLMGGGFSRPANPIPGTDMAGTVESVGKNVTAFRQGDSVFGETSTRHQWANGGAYAEYVTVREEWLASKPANVTFEQAASVPSSGFIALLNLRDTDRMQVGRRVLINGAGGGVGTLALQIVKAHGAHVTAVDSTGKLDMLRSLGADEVIDYAEEDFTRRGILYDLVWDVPGNHRFSACRRALKPDGRYVLIGHERFGAAGSHAFGIFPQFLWLVLLSRFVAQLRGPGSPLPTRQETIATLQELLADGTITPIIDSVFPLSDAGAAFRHLIAGEPRGKVVLTP